MLNNVKKKTDHISSIKLEPQTIKSRKEIYSKGQKGIEKFVS